MFPTLRLSVSSQPNERDLYVSKLEVKFEPRVPTLRPRYLMVTLWQPHLKLGNTEITFNCEFATPWLKLRNTQPQGWKQDILNFPGFQHKYAIYDKKNKKQYLLNN